MTQNEESQWIDWDEFDSDEEWTNFFLAMDKDNIEVDAQQHDAMSTHSCHPGTVHSQLPSGTGMPATGAWHRSLAPPPVRPAGAPAPMYVPESPPHAEEPKAPNKMTVHIQLMKQLIIECWAAGLTQPQAAQKLNMSVESLKQQCKMCNLGRWRRRYGGTKGITLECLAGYKNEGLSMKEIATRHNVHKSSVQRQMRKLGIIDWTHFMQAV
jgi:DNA-binding CsgD family transcriptional regulator